MSADPPLAAPVPVRFLDPERIKVYPRLLGAAFLAVTVWWFFGTRGLLDARGTPIGSDFIAFYAAGEAVLAGDPTSAYDVDRTSAIANRVVEQALDSPVSWNYPPLFLLIAAPLALLPYLVALALWQLATLGLFLFVVRRIAPYGRTIPVALAFSATFLNLLHGQTAFLSAALVGLFLLNFVSRPWLAGAALGATAFKPHFGLAMSVLAVVALRWRVLAGAAVTVLALSLLSLLLFGRATWDAFLASTSGTGELMLVQGGPGWHKMITLFAALRGWGTAIAPALALQAVVTLACGAMIARLWHTSRDPDTGERSVSPSLGAAVATSTLLMPPYALDYDLVIAGVALAYFARGYESVSNRASMLLAFAWLMPLASRVLAANGVPLAAPTLLLMLALAWRVRSAEGARTTSAPAPAPS